MEWIKQQLHSALLLGNRAVYTVSSKMRDQLSKRKHQNIVSNSWQKSQNSFDSESCIM